MTRDYFVEFGSGVKWSNVTATSLGGAVLVGLSSILDNPFTIKVWRSDAAGEKPDLVIRNDKELQILKKKETEQQNALLLLVIDSLKDYISVSDYIYFNDTLANRVILQPII